ncbi:hypothetical protein [Streptomyces curacoi]|nr:hypothetical protein [Streptomyces curacoi]
MEASRVPTRPHPRQPDAVRDAIPPQLLPLGEEPPTADVRPAPTDTPRHPTPTPAPDRTRTTAPPTSVTPAAPRSEATPPQAATAAPAPTPAPELPKPPNASTELVSEARSEVRSATPTERSPIGPAPRRAGASLARAEAMTERRPAPAEGRASGGARSYPAVPPGGFPGPVASAGPRRERRRTGMIAVGVLAAGAVVAVVLATNSGSPRDDDQAGSPASPSSSAASSPGSSPSPTVEGTSRPQSLPPGARREAGGFAWVTPEGWRRDIKTGSEVHYTSPDGRQELAAKSALARGDLMDSWEKSEQNAHQGQDYRKIRLERTTFRGHPAVVWEYTFTLQGLPWHARLLGFTADGKSYQINTWYQPDVEREALRTYGEVRDSFTVL